MLQDFRPSRLNRHLLWPLLLQATEAFLEGESTPGQSGGILELGERHDELAQAMIDRPGFPQRMEWLVRFSLAGGEQFVNVCQRFIDLGIRTDPDGTSLCDLLRKGSAQNALRHNSPRLRIPKPRVGLLWIAKFMEIGLGQGRRHNYGGPQSLHRLENGRGSRQCARLCSVDDDRRDLTSWDTFEDPSRIRHEDAGPTPNRRPVA